MTAFLGEWLQRQASRRDATGLHRELQPRDASNGVIDLASNDYLGLAHHPTVVARAVEAAEQWGCGATGSRLVTGTTQLHEQLEIGLARFAEAPAALVFSSGYAANIGVITALGDAETLIVSDLGNHASLIDGCRLARGRVVVAPHLDVDAVGVALASRGEERALVVTDAVFSVDGEAAALRELHEVCGANEATLIVDEAHSLGIVGHGGRGLVHGLGLGADPNVIRTVTLSKSLGAQGGAVLASRAVVDHLVDVARSFIFDTALAPPAVGAALGALELLQSTPQLAARAHDNARRLASLVDGTPPEAAITSVFVEDPLRAVAAARRCLVEGVRVGCFRPPSVPDGRSRLRLAARADLGFAELEQAAATIRRALVKAA
ncbi:MAG TPA: 8-amino-7-oxononanoate synthase [Mycobacteriales bacterium]|nr:8-amino-7-oxononanoate synthase [Mycobacteriales bacterium]